MSPGPRRRPATRPRKARFTLEWRREVITLEAIVGPGAETHSFASLSDPCQGCQAYCCTHLVFPQPTPQSMSNLDFFRYCLGFPGIEVGFGDDGWSLVVKSTCRHLVGNRCGVYGLPERPLPCQHYDGWQCSYKPRLGQARPAGFVRLGLEHFDWLADCFRFDGNGQVAQASSLDEVREHVEARWRESQHP